jgi:hypothetical protein
MAVFEDPCLEPGFELPTDAGGYPCFGQEGCMIDAVERAHMFIPLSTTHVLWQRTS